MQQKIVELRISSIMPDNPEKTEKTNFIRDIVAADVASGKNGGDVITRFPPEPNGFLHIGHAKAICISFGIADDFNGRTHLRFDDTNPVKEEQKYIDAIREDIKWLGFDWGEHEYYASDYFEQLYAWAQQLIRNGKAYVDDQTVEEVRANRGTVKTPGTNSPYRERSVEENLELFQAMRDGKYKDGEKVLRAKIDMASPNMNLRDPAMYRVLNAHHPRTGDAWCIYPMYDFAHGQSDSIEGITHSLCSLEFEDHRPLYDWFCENLNIHHPQQIEFARLNLTYTMMSKRKLLQLVQDGHVSGWDDPRMPTLSGMRRLGYPPKAIRNFCDTIGVTKFNSMTDIALLEHAVRDVLNKTSPRVMGVMNPLKVTITNYPENQSEEWLEAVNNPEDESAGTRQVPFSKTLYIEQDDFMEDPSRKFFRLGPGREVRLRWAYFVTCNEVVKNDAGEVIELKCTYDPATKGGDAPDGRKVKGTLHWVSANHALPVEARLYDRLFNVENPNKTKDGQTFVDYLNPDSLQVTEAMVEPSVKAKEPGERVQFERIGYFCVDDESTSEKLIFNRTVPLRDSWKGK